MPGDIYPPANSNTVWEQYVWPACMGTALLTVVITSLVHLSRPVQDEDEAISATSPASAPQTLPSPVNGGIKLPTKHELAEFESESKHFNSEVLKITWDLSASANEYQTKLIKLGLDELLEVDSLVDAEGNAKAKSRLKLAHQYVKKFEQKVNDCGTRWRKLLPPNKTDPIFPAMRSMVREERKILNELEGIVDFLGTRLNTITRINGKYYFSDDEGRKEFLVRAERLEDMFRQQEENKQQTMQKLRDAK